MKRQIDDLKHELHVIFGGLENGEMTREEAVKAFTGAVMGYLSDLNSRVNAMEDVVRSVLKVAAE